MTSKRQDENEKSENILEMVPEYIDQLVISSVDVSKSDFQSVCEKYLESQRKISELQSKISIKKPHKNAETQTDQHDIDSIRMRGNLMVLSPTHFMKIDD